jgi:hypothetical protein
MVRIKNLTNLKTWKNFVTGRGNTLCKRAIHPFLVSFTRGNVVMFHIGLCGSKVLVDLVSQHPQVFWDGEIYYRYSNRQKVDTLSSTPGLVCKEGKRIFQLRIPLSGKRCYGFEVQLHLLDPFHMILPEYLQLFHRYKFSHFIILRRKNYLRKTLSSLIANKDGRWHQSHT